MERRKRMSGVIGIRLRAPAKINWTLEVLRRRDDGYHELRTILQTIDLADTLTFHPADDLSLAIRGADESSLGPLEANLVLRAAMLLRTRFQVTQGAAIELEKRIPSAAGLGGGSSDAAAALRGLARLWEIDLTADTLVDLAAQLGSDAPFFVYGGTALAEGRGERLSPLPDAPPGELALLPGEAAEGKTAKMFGALQPSDFPDGDMSLRVAQRLAQGTMRSIDQLDAYFVNTFENVARDVFPGYARRSQALHNATGRPARLAGAGPTLFAVAPPGVALPEGALRVRTLTRAEALHMEMTDG